MTTTITRRFHGAIAAGATKRVASNGVSGGEDFDPWGASWGSAWGAAWRVTQGGTIASPAIKTTARVADAGAGTVTKRVAHVA